MYSWGEDEGEGRRCASGTVPARSALHPNPLPGVPGRGSKRGTCDCPASAFCFRIERLKRLVFRIAHVIIPGTLTQNPGGPAIAFRRQFFSGEPTMLAHKIL